MAKLTDKQKKRIIADRVNGMSFRKLADKYHVSTTTIQKVLNGNKEVLQKITQKKEQNTLDMISFLDSRKGDAQDFLVLAMKYLQDEDKLKRTGVQAIATAMGIVIDKFIQNVPQTQQSNNLLQEIRDGIAEGRSNVE